MPPPKTHLLDRVSSPARSSSSVATTWLGWAVAACVAVIALWFGQLYFTAHTENSLLRQEQALAATALRSSQNQLEAERILSQRQFDDAARRVRQLEQHLQAAASLDRLQIAILAPTADGPPQARAVVVWDPTGHQGVVQLAKLPPKSSDSIYKLSITTPSLAAIPVDGGEFHVEAGTGNARVRFQTNQPVPTGARFTISLEPLDRGQNSSPAIVLLSN